MGMPNVALFDSFIFLFYLLNCYIVYVYICIQSLFIAIAYFYISIPSLFISIVYVLFLFYIR